MPGPPKGTGVRKGVRKKVNRADLAEKLRLAIERIDVLEKKLDEAGKRAEEAMKKAEEIEQKGKRLEGRTFLLGDWMLRG